MVHRSAYSDWGEATEGRVGSVGVVLDAPGFDDVLRLEEGAELLEVQQLVAGLAVEALDERVDHGEPSSM